MELTAIEQLIHQMYIAYYQRPADPEGLAYWVDQIQQHGSWEAVSAAFGAPENAEYQALYGSKPRAELVAELYQAAFNRAAVQEEIDFWVASEHTDMNLAFAIINGAQNDDLATVNNKVAYSAELASQLGTNTAYLSLNDSKALLTAITKDSTVDSTTVAADITADTVVAGETFTLTKGLEDLDAANTALADFLAAADGDNDPDTSTTGVAIEGDYNTAVAAATDLLVDGDYTNASAAVKAALLSAQETANAEALATAEEEVADANAEIAKVAGLTEAVAAAKAAQATEEAAIEAATAAQIAEDAASAAWVITANGGAKVDTATNTAGVLTVAVDDATDSVFADNTVLTLTKVSATTGVVSLAEADASWNADQVAFFEAQQALAADLITKFNASVSADAAAAAATEASDAADLAAALLDKGDEVATATAWANVGAGFTETTVANAAKPTAEEIAAEIAALTKIENDGQSALASAIALVAWDSDAATTKTAHNALTTQAETDGFIDATSKAAIDDAFDNALTAESDLTDAIAASIEALADATNVGGALDTFEGLVDAYYTAELADTPLQDDLATAEGNVETAQDAIDLLTETVAEEQELLDLLNQFTELDDAVTAAETALADADYVVSTITAIQAATADNDAYLLGSVDGIISSFGAAGEDSIFLGTDYVLNTGDVDTDGNNSALEIFLTEDLGGNTTVTIETSAFGSNASTPEVIEVVLTGVGADELTLVDGLLTIA
jgi:Arc/MetJ-type ribon-helix-helix transcriptional regulator